jgi:hyperosmotically inducible protein
MKNIKALFIFSALIVTLLVSGASAQGKYRPQTTVEQQVFKKIVNLPRYSVFDFIRYEVKGDTVVLSGKVYSLGTKSDAAAAIKKVAGVARIVNNIEQLPASPYDDQIRRSLLRQFDRGGLSRYLSEIRPDMRIVVENGRVTLEGYVASKADRDLANVYANGVSGVFDVQNNLIVGRDWRRS